MTTWTPALVEARLEEAAWVLKRMPEPRVRGYFSTWPEILRSFGDMVGQEPRPMKLVPSPQAITRMEETLTWTSGLDPIDGKIVWLRAHRTRWKQICWTVGLKRSAANQHWLYALCVISLRLNGRRVNPNLSMQRVIDTTRGALLVATAGETLSSEIRSHAEPRGTSAWTEAVADRTSVQASDLGESSPKSKPRLDRISAFA